MINEACHIKSRRRASSAEMSERKAALLDIVEEMKPMTVRQVFYQATVRDVVEKTEAGYVKVQRALVDMRRSGELPYRWIADNTRWQRKPETFRSPQEALRETARLYRKSLWADADCYVEIWLEKDALSSVVYDVTADFDVPLMVARGYASLSFLHTSAEQISEFDKPTYIYHLGDFDPSGVNAAHKIEETLTALAPDAEIYFERLAVHPEQIEVWELPTRPTKKSDSRAKGFGAVSVELDAIPPDTLRGLVRSAIEDHLPADQYDVLKAAEASERQLIAAWAGAA